MWEWSRNRRIAPAQMLRVKDGDTFVFLVDTSFHQRAEWPFRLRGYDAWEKKDLYGPVAISFAAAWFEQHRHGFRFPFLMITYMAGEFEEFSLGRFVAEIRCEEEGNYGPELAAAGMVKS